MRRDILLIALALCVVVSGFFLYGAGNFVSHRSAIHFIPDDPASNREYWRGEIAARGPSAAYEEFKRLNSTVPEGRQHISAHVFGTLLYDAEGASGIKYCDPAFAFGCFHGFFLAAVAKEGDGLIQPLDEACVSAFGPLGTGCQHGIGHGILEYLGHDKLNDALQLCAKTTETVPLLGCSSGVFMEYFLRSGFLANSAEPNPLPFDPHAPYGPCPSVPGRYLKSCYFNLPLWWHSAAPAHASRDMGGLCSKLSGDAREDCYLGVGDIVSQDASFDAEKADSQCDFLSDGNGAMLCRAGVAWNLFSNQKGSSASLPCDGLSAPESLVCRAKADYTEGRDPHAP